jgi:beta-glucanase (GH16 family)
LGFASSVCLSPQPTHAAGWKLSWSEEFTGPAINTQTWGYESGYVRNEEDQYYTNRPENAFIDSGHLVIRALRDNWQGREYTSASLRTLNKQSFLYGKFEMRARIDTRAGSWPAWWWLPNSGGWPKGGEVDMMEFYQGKCLFNVMDGNQRWTTKTKTVTSLGGSRWSNAFHVWTMEWDSTRIELSLDGELINEYDLRAADGTGPQGVNPFTRPGYFIVNQALGGTQGGDPSQTDFPMEYHIDWIRVHTWTEGQAHALTVTGGTSSGDYLEKDSVSLVAQMPAAGMEFRRWEIQSGTAAIENLTDPNTRLIMGNTPVTVRSVYAEIGSPIIPKHWQIKKGQLFPSNPTFWETLRRACGIRGFSD